MPKGKALRHTPWSSDSVKDGRTASTTNTQSRSVMGWQRMPCWLHPVGMPTYVNKAFLEHSHPHTFTCWMWTKIRLKPDEAETMEPVRTGRPGQLSDWEAPWDRLE